MNKSLYLDLPFHLIQSIRLSHALMETSYDVYLPLEHEEKFSALKKYFAVNYKLTSEPLVPLPGLRIVHSEPQTYVGSIAYPLIFPQSIFSYCREQWAENRENRFAFAGLITNSRKLVLEKWIIENSNGKSVNLKTNVQPSFFSKVKAKALGLCGIKPEPKAVKRRFKEVIFWASQRGRVFPFKSWDDEYFKLLSHTQFVLCPNGDYIWSYRFFEAIMCGAIPIVESDCSAYDGFRFRSMAESAKDMVWSQEDAEYNFKMCRERLTVPKEKLEEEIARQLKFV